MITKAKNVIIENEYHIYLSDKSSGAKKEGRPQIHPMFCNVLPGYTVFQLFYKQNLTLPALKSFKPEIGCFCHT